MKIGILSDAHGNIAALEKCLNYLYKIDVDKIYFLGDGVGYYPNGIEVLNLLIKENIHCLLGNHEAMLIGILNCSQENEQVYQLEKVRKEITLELRDFLHKLKPHYEFIVDNKKVKLMHGGPSDFLTEYIYPDNDLEEFALMPYDFCFIGHTHIPFIKVKKGRTIINVGSCGMPRDHGILSSFAVLDTDLWEVGIFRIQFDTKILEEKFGKSIHPTVFELFKRQPSHFTGILVHE